MDELHVLQDPILKKDAYVFISKGKRYAPRFVNCLRVSLVPKIWKMQEQDKVKLHFFAANQINGRYVGKQRVGI